MLYAILIALGVILISANRGIVVNFGDSLLGRIEGYGSPIRVAAHVQRIRNNIDDDALALFEEQRLGVSEDLLAFPLREAEEGLLSLPMRTCPEDNASSCSATWTATKKGVKQPFSGWIVAEDNPIWLTAMENDPAGASDPLTVILNRNVVSGRLDLSAYRDALEAHLPPAELEKLPKSLENMEEIYLFSQISLPRTSGKSGDAVEQSALTSYRVVQVDSLPSLSQVAFLILNPTASGLYLGQESADVAFDPNLLRSGAEVIYGFDIFFDAPGFRGDRGKEAVLSGLRSCLGSVAQWSEDGAGDHRIELAGRLPANMVLTCLEQSGLVADRDYLILKRGTQALIASENGWRMRCDVIPHVLHFDEDREACRAGDETIIKRRWFENWDRADVYVKNRRDVIEVRDALIAAKIPVPNSQREEQAFELGTLYSDSISRFGYLLGVMDWIVRPIAGLAAFALVYILGTQLFVLVSRRRKAYGTLLARGMPEHQVRWMLLTQVLAAVLLGAALAFIIAESAQYLFAAAFETTLHAETARTELGQRNPKLIDRLTFSGWNGFGTSLWDELKKIISVAGIIGVVSVACTWGLLRFYGLRQGAVPIDLLK